MEFILLAALVALYFLPTIAAWGRKNIAAIFVLNLLLGWTIIGWCVAMIWAFMED